ncbi:MAG: hypothetical protein LH615_14800 [Ferruginibacter sp.]|nr:hypothetical protein [Ferruginibacter sp.]
MKKLLLSLLILVAGFAAKAQEVVPDQNPNYKVSMEKYQAIQITQTTMNTTVQDTYRAYDWSTAKAERKAERRTFRRERALFNNYNNGWNNNNWNNGWNNNNWNNGWNNNRSNNNFNPFFFRW